MWPRVCLTLVEYVATCVSYFSGVCGHVCVLLLWSMWPRVCHNLVEHVATRVSYFSGACGHVCVIL